MACPFSKSRQQSFLCCCARCAQTRPAVQRLVGPALSMQIALSTWSVGRFCCRPVCGRLVVVLVRTLPVIQVCLEFSWKALSTSFRFALDQVHHGRFDQSCEVKVCALAEIPQRVASKCASAAWARSFQTAKSFSRVCSTTPSQHGVRRPLAVFFAAWPSQHPAF